MFTKSLCIAAIAAFACSLATAPANARARVFVASYGNDSNPCTFGSPCKTFQSAVNVVDPGGEVTAIDSAGFGPITITHAVTITSPDGVEAGIVPPAGGAAITINAGTSDHVVLRGLTLDGSGVGFDGVVFNSGAGLTIANCVVQNFIFDGSNISTGHGILIQPTSGTFDFAITNTTAANNGGMGILFDPPNGTGTLNVNGAIDHVVVTGNSSDGMGFATGDVTGGSVVISISNSVASNNGRRGIEADGGTVTFTISIDGTNMNGNAGTGVAIFGKVQAYLGRSVSTGNHSAAVQNSTSPNTFFSYKNNQFDQSISTLNTTLPLQ